MAYQGYLARAAYGEPAPARACNNRKIPDPDPVPPRALTPRRIWKCTPERAFGVTDPTGVLTRAVARAVEMLDNTIAELVNTRREVCQNGAAPAFPLLGDMTICWLRNRLGVCVDDIRVWTNGTFVSGSVAEVIRRLVRVRNLLASNVIRYICRPRPCTVARCDTGVFAYVCDLQRVTPPRIIRLCEAFWVCPDCPSPEVHAEFQAQTLIHEASHLTHDTSDDPGSTIGVAECLSQLVAVSNGSPIDEAFARDCVQSRRCGPPGDCPGVEFVRLGFAAPPKIQSIRTVFNPRRAVRLKGRLSKWIKRRVS